MNKYLGSYTNVYAAVCCLIFSLCPCCFGVFVLMSGFKNDTISVFVFCIFCSVIFSVYTITVSDQLYSWGKFENVSVRVRTLFGKGYIIEYDKCTDVGIGYYVHGLLNGGVKVYYIYLSYKMIDKRHISNINLLKPSNGFVKVGFSKKVYKYLLKTLPKRQATMLLTSFIRHFGAKGSVDNN